MYRGLRYLVAARAPRPCPCPFRGRKEGYSWWHPRPAHAGDEEFGTLEQLGSPTDMTLALELYVVLELSETEEAFDCFASAKNMYTFSGE